MHRIACGRCSTPSEPSSCRYTRTLPIRRCYLSTGHAAYATHTCTTHSRESSPARAGFDGGSSTRGLDTPSPRRDTVVVAGNRRPADDFAPRIVVRVYEMPPLAARREWLQSATGVFRVGRRQVCSMADA